MNWGKGIIAGMILFMLYILSMCIYMFMLPVDQYDHQYYEKGLNFDKDFNKEKQVFKDHAVPLFRISSKQLYINFAAPSRGNIRFIRPSNSALDTLVPIKLTSSNEQIISLGFLNKGNWELLLDWQSSNNSYLYQYKLYVR